MINFFFCIFYFTIIIKSALNEKMTIANKIYLMSRWLENVRDSLFSSIYTPRLCPI